jgi:hypothetical protein
MVALRSLRASLLALGCASVLMSPLALAEKTFPGIKQLMDEKTFNAAGLQQLSLQELKALDRWLIHYTANEADILQKTVAEVKEEANTEIHSAIDGSFHGWKGKTKFRLQNGQVWEQRYSNTWHTQLDSPKVTISKNFFGFYDMKVEGTKRTIGVRRVQ